jgi:hypothetical protein
MRWHRHRSEKKIPGIPDTHLLNAIDIGVTPVLNRL